MDDPKASKLSEQLTPLRQKIDALDEQILALLNQRAAVATEVGEIKSKVGAAIFRPERELQVIARLQGMAAGPLVKGPLGDIPVASIWREIMSACRSLEGLYTVAFLGPAGTFSEQAALAFFGNSVVRQAVPSIDEIFRSVASGSADYGVVPIENSSEGAIDRTLDLLLSTPLKLCGEVALNVKHNLLRKKLDMEGIFAVCAHPQALAQCQGWLAQYLPNAERRAVASNAEGARLAAQSDTIAAIASEQSAQIYGLQISAAGIQDDPYNRTRFGIVRRADFAAASTPTGKDCTSLILSVHNKAGAVFEMLKPLRDKSVSMMRFESRPARTGGNWEYFFYVDIEGHEHDANVAEALKLLEQSCSYYKCLGSFPQSRMA
jgi:chorismate mutase / prephenate dehydratase